MEIEDEFTNYVNKALEELPAEFKEKLDNVNIFVEDYPTREQFVKLRMRPEHTLLLGLYEGIPQTKRGNYGQGVLPDKITLFKMPILSLAQNREHLVQLIKDTLFHEVGHHFGMSEKEIRDAQSKRTY